MKEKSDFRGGTSAEKLAAVLRLCDFGAKGGLFAGGDIPAYREFSAFFSFVLSKKLGLHRGKAESLMAISEFYADSFGALAGYVLLPEKEADGTRAALLMAGAIASNSAAQYLSREAVPPENRCKVLKSLNSESNRVIFHLAYSLLDLKRVVFCDESDWKADVDNSVPCALMRISAVLNLALAGKTETADFSENLEKFISYSGRLSALEEESAFIAGNPGAEAFDAFLRVRKPRFLSLMEPGEFGEFSGMERNSRRAFFFRLAVKRDIPGILGKEMEHYRLGRQSAAEKMGFGFPAEPPLHGKPGI